MIATQEKATTIQNESVHPQVGTEFAPGMLGMSHEDNETFSRDQIAEIIASAPEEIRKDLEQTFSNLYAIAGM